MFFGSQNSQFEIVIYFLHPHFQHHAILDMLVVDPLEFYISKQRHASLVGYNKNLPIQVYWK